VNFFPSKRFNIEEIDFIGLANIGLQGIPGVTLQISNNFSIFFPTLSAISIIFSSQGYSHEAFLIVAS